MMVLVLMSLSTITSEQTKGMERTMEKALQVLYYLATHPHATVRFCASDMILNIHSALRRIISDGAKIPQQS
jgi:hypothetical protein